MRQMFILFELKYQPNDNRKIYKLTRERDACLSILLLVQMVTSWTKCLEPSKTIQRNWTGLENSDIHFNVHFEYYQSSVSERETGL